jgi:hypothetical protein
VQTVFDAGFDETAHMPFLCMELLEGEHLERVVAANGPLPPATLVTYFRQICSALDRAHGYVDKDGTPKPIVHRDLKPENLFLCRRESGDPIVKILDFGIAKVLSSSTKVSQDIKGTPLYMAYEQASAERITAQTDIWALGLIAFFLLTGRCYWKAANLPEPSFTQLFGEVLTMNVDPPSRRAAELGASVVPSPAFDAWFSRCVNRDVSQRFSSAGECAAALNAALLGSSVEPRVASDSAAFAATEYAPNGASAAIVAAVSAQFARTSKSPVAATGSGAVRLRGGGRWRDISRDAECVRRAPSGIGRCCVPPYRDHGIRVAIDTERTRCDRRASRHSDRDATSRCTNRSSRSRAERERVRSRRGEDDRTHQSQRQAGSGHGPTASRPIPEIHAGRRGRRWGGTSANS